MTTVTADKRLRSRPTEVDSCDPGRVAAALRERGAVLVTGRHALDDFTELADALMVPLVHPLSDTGLRSRVGDGRSCTVDLGNEAVHLHRELSYLPGCPDILMFYADRPADTGGETLLADGIEVLGGLPPDVRKLVTDAVMRWRWELTEVRWKATLGENKEEALVALDRLLSTCPPWETLRTEFVGTQLNGVLDSRFVIPTQWDGQPAFCNSLINIYHRDPDVEYTRWMDAVIDGEVTMFSDDVLKTITRVAEEYMYGVPWEAGNILLVDNSRFLHGRGAFTGERSIFSRIGYAHRGGPLEPLHRMHS